MIHSSSSRSRHGEDTPLLPLQERHSDNLCPRFHCLQRLPSKAIFLILPSTMIVSELYTLIHITIASFIGSYVPMEANHFLNALSSPLGLVSAILAAIAIFYPLSGFLADVWCGRFKIIMIGLTTIFLAFIIVIISFTIWFSLNHDHMNMVFVILKYKVPLYITGFGAAFFIVLGYAAYQANFI